MNPYLDPLRLLFEKNRDPIDAAKMKKYMKGQYEYYGIKAPHRRDLMKRFTGDHGVPELKEIPSLVRECWNDPHRDYQYVAMEMLFKMKKKMDEDAVALFEFMITNKSWWDTVDYIAVKLVGEHFGRFPDLIPGITRKWMDSGNIWLRRTCVLFQLHYKKETDLNRLDSFITQLHGSKEFFINKAIGWALREYSKTDAVWVVNYVETHDLAPLSSREALKWLARKNQAG